MALLAALALAACGDSDESPQGGEGGAQVGGATETSGGAARGGSDGGGSGGSKGPTGGEGARARSEPVTTKGGVALTGNVKEARRASRTVSGVYDRFDAAAAAGLAKADVDVGVTLDAAEDSDSVTRICDLMSAGARRQTVVYARRAAGLADVDWNCAKATALLLRRSGQQGGLKRTTRARVVGINAEGDRATATIQLGPKAPLTTLPLVKEGGEWKLAANAVGGPSSSE